MENAVQIAKDNEFAVYNSMAELAAATAALNFDVTGHADVTEIVMALAQLNAQGHITQEGMQALAN